MEDDSYNWEKYKAEFMTLWEDKDKNINPKLQPWVEI